MRNATQNTALSMISADFGFMKFNCSIKVTILTTTSTDITTSTYRMSCIYLLAISYTGFPKMFIHKHDITNYIKYKSYMVRIEGINSAQNCIILNHFSICAFHKISKIMRINIFGTPSIFPYIIWQAAPENGTLFSSLSHKNINVCPLSINL